jgi:hypothetical protein
MEKSIALESLPKLFHDFITVAAALGARYVWIDALCIIQDDFEDWVKEAASMNLVYGNSYLTIAATAAPDPTHSLFPDRLCHGVSALGDRLPESAFLDAGILHNCKEDPKWFTRGWTFQEYLLSARVLHFGESELVWHCNEIQRCECGNVQATRSRREMQMTKLRGAFGIALRKFASRPNWAEKDLSAWKATKVTAWHTCAERYSERALSNPADHTVAISGIAEAFTKARLGNYYAGSWELSFAEDLCWQLSGYSGIPNASHLWKLNGRPSDYLAPSWSWLAAGRPVKFHHGIHIEEQIALQSCEIQTEFSRQWAKVIGGYANIKALGVRIKLTVDSKRQLYMHPRYLNQHAGIIAYETEGEPCGTLDHDPTIQEEKFGISSDCLLITTYLAQHMPDKGSLMRIGTLIVLEEVGENLTTPDPATYFDPQARIPTPSSLGGRLRLRLTEEINLSNPPKIKPPKFHPLMEHRRIGILKVRIDYQKMLSLYPLTDWKII